MFRTRLFAAAVVVLLTAILLQAQQPAAPTVATSFKGHTGEVYSVAYSPDGKYLVTGSFDRTLKIWDASTGKEIKTFGGANGHQNLILSMAMSPDGTLIASGSS